PIYRTSVKCKNMYIHVNIFYIFVCISIAFSKCNSPDKGDKVGYNNNKLSETGLKLYSNFRCMDSNFGAWTSNFPGAWIANFRCKLHNFPDARLQSICILIIM